MHIRLKNAELKVYNKFITWYKTILNQKINVIGKLSNQKQIELIPERLGMIMR